VSPFTHPVDGEFSWINQGGASVDDTYGGVCLTAPAALPINLRLRVKTAPATPYVITAAVLSMFIGDAGAAGGTYGGLCWRESGSGKIVGFVYFGLNANLYVTKYTDPNTFSAVYVQQEWATRESFIFLRIADDGVDRTCAISENGQDWIEFHSVGRTDFLTADQVGFFGATQVAISAPHVMNVVHWKET